MAETGKNDPPPTPTTAPAKPTPPNVTKVQAGSRIGDKLPPIPPAKGK